VPEFAAIACPVELPGIGVIYSVCIAGTMKSVVEENKAKYGELLKARSKQLSAAIQMKISQSQPSSQFS
jgi:DNA-binding IclR family transcriptional regulator